jgi:hypothetical protein
MVPKTHCCQFGRWLKNLKSQTSFDSFMQPGCFYAFSSCEVCAVTPLRRFPQNTHTPEYTSSPAFLDMRARRHHLDTLSMQKTRIYTSISSSLESHLDSMRRIVVAFLGPANIAIELSGSSGGAKNPMSGIQRCCSCRRCNQDAHYSSYLI